MDKNNVIELERLVIGTDPLTELLKEGARKLLAQAVESEVQDLLAQHQDCRTACGHAGVVRMDTCQNVTNIDSFFNPIRVDSPLTISFQHLT